MSSDSRAWHQRQTCPFYRVDVPDDLFAVPRLARVYDDLDGPRDDLDHYHAIVDEFSGRSVLDIGCGTGTFACQLVRRGLHCTGLDPAAASLAMARSKPDAERVQWIQTEATAIPTMSADVATMTGNVAQVFLDDDEWCRVVSSARHALRAGGLFVFETRETSARSWERWTREATFSIYNTIAEGRIEHWAELTQVALPLVSFTLHYLFESDGTLLTSQSTLRFRSNAEIERSLTAGGFRIIDIRDAPDRPGLENVFLARAN